MMITNFTAQDILGIFAGFLLFALIFVPSGYVTGFALNLFDFRSRRWSTRLGFALLLSSAITPVFLFITYRMVSEALTFIVLLAFTILFLLQISGERKFHLLFHEIKENKQLKIFVGIAIGWIAFTAFSLIDLQFGDRLYFNITAFDYQTRVSVINAITRTGVPPLNPSYHPGVPVKLTFLYYFWYILCSLVDKLGGDIVDARMALAASVIWAGLALMATVALYIKIRNSGIPNIGRSALMGIGLLAVSGLDIFGSTLYMAFPQLLYGYVIDGDIEHWNEQITAWVGSTMWTPHHLVSLLNCVLGIMLIVYHKNAKPLQKFGSAVIAGIAFASAFGLSSWVTMIFVIFWMVWFIMRLLNGETFKSVWVMLIPSVVATIVIFPFILDLYGGGSGGSAGLPLGFDIRVFRPALILTTGLPGWQAALINLIMLPLNYFLELGFFFFIGIVWYKLRQKGYIPNNPLAKEEIALLIIVVFLTSFTRSTLISNNDFGWRGWLPGQFILLIWGTDVLSHIWKKKPIKASLLLLKPSPANQIKFLLLLLLALGVVTSLQDTIYLRLWPILVDTGVLVLPEPIQSDEYLGTKNFEARTAYSIIEKNYPMDTIVQFNPLVGLDRPSGLYRTRGAVISYHTLYGIPPEIYKPFARKMAQLFTTPNTNWVSIDTACKNNQIKIIIFADTDEIWDQISSLSKERQSIFSGNYYSAFECGE
ncbi:MAG: hypothetical protein IPP66_16505 [Anaerolineales bacterium]|nr:hypothetical protein [Anaerolineales bacterium]